MYCGASTEGANGKSSADYLAQSREVRQHVVEFLRAAGRNAKSRHDFVEDQHRAFGIAKSAKLFEKAWLRKIESRIGGNGLENNRCDFVPISGKSFLDDPQIVKWYGNRKLCESRRDPGAIRLTMRQSAASGLDEQGVDMSVVAAFELDDLIPASESTSKTDAAHGCLGAAVDHSHFFHRGNQIADRLRHLDLQWVRDSEAQAIGSGGADGGNHGVRRMAEDGGAPGPHIVNELPALDCEDAGPFSS